MGRFAVALLVGLALPMSMAAVVSPSASARRQRVLLPVDEAARQPDFFSFRAALQAAIARRDTEALLAAVHPQIKNTFGGDDGADAFRRIWQLDAGAPPAPDGASGPEGSESIWSELGTVLALGGSFTDEQTFVAPYTFSRWPDEIDAFEHVVLIGSSVRVRAAPRADAPARRLATFEILPIARPSDMAAGWIAVQSGAGRTGYVAAALARSPIDYRAIFRREAGRWQLLTFVAGD